MAVVDVARADDGPTYTRRRANARVYGNWAQGGEHGSLQQGFYGGYAYAPPVVAGSWYARPYPYHFDYYRMRYSGQPVEPACPCAEPTIEDAQ